MNVFLDFRLQRTKKLKRKIGSSPLADRQVRFFSPKNFSVAQFNFFAFRGVLPFFSTVGELFILLLAASKSWSSNINKKTVRMIKIICHSRYATLHWLAGLGYSLSYAVMLLWLPQSYVLCLDRSIEDHLEKVPGNRENEKKFKSLRYLRFLTISYYRLPCRAWAARALPGWA